MASATHHCAGSGNNLFGGFLPSVVDDHNAVVMFVFAISTTLVKLVSCGMSISDVSVRSLRNSQLLGTQRGRIIG